MTGCSFSASTTSGSTSDDAVMSDAAEIDAPVVDVDACTTCTIYSSCKALLAAQPTTQSGVYDVDPDGAGGADPFPVYCDMSTANGGWTLVGRERTGVPAASAGPLRYLGIDTMNPLALANGTESGILAMRFSALYGEVMVTWGASFIRFSKPAGFDMFSNTINTAINISGFSTSETTTLGTWVQQGGGARLCVAARSNDVRPGDTSWAIKPRNDNHTTCGCNDMAWSGRGAYYGGTPEGSQTACTGWGGGWAGVKDEAVQKGGLAPMVETRLWIR